MGYLGLFLAAFGAATLLPLQSEAVLGGLGTLVVVKRFAFFSEAVGHAALTGRRPRLSLFATCHAPWN